jgi:phage terminase large subunit GpA-like protein
MPSLPFVQRFVKQRIDPMIEATPELRRKVGSNGKRADRFSKPFPGGVYVVTGAESASSLSSMPAKYLFADEVDRFPIDVEGEGDPIKLAVARTLTFGHRSKVFIPSTPTLAGQSRIEEEYEKSDKRVYEVPCPHCGHMQALQWESLRWEKGKPQTVHYLCGGCEKPIYEYHKTDMLATGKWRATAVAQTPGHYGYLIHALYSPVGWLSWQAIAAMWEDAQGNAAKLKTFVNTILGRVWQEDGNSPDWEVVGLRREAYDARIIPASVCVLTAGVDVQGDRLECDVWGWGPGNESWLVGRETIFGDPQQALVWQELTKVLRRQWPHADGGVMQIMMSAIDSGDGDTTLRVYSFCRDFGPQSAAVKGQGGYNKASPVTGPSYIDFTVAGRTFKRGARLWHVSSDVFKSETYGQLRLPYLTPEQIDAGEAYAPGYIHMPQMLASDEWIQQLVGEQYLKTQTRKGMQWQWKKIRERNEALDCRVYARAAAAIVGVDRATEDHWRGWRASINRVNSPVARPKPRLVASDAGSSY